MKLLFKQRIFSWIDSYDIYDENGNIKEIKNSRLFTKTDNAKIYRLGNGDVIKLWKK